MKRVLLTILASIMCAFTPAKKEAWQKGLAIVEYNAKFNESNTYKDIKKLYDVNKFMIWVDDNPYIQEQEGIMSVPSLVLYYNGKEITRWEAGISLQLRVDYMNIQREIDKITGANKF